MKILVFQHAAAEHPGSFREFMKADGVQWEAIELDAGEAIPDLAGYDALMAFGGPMDVWQEAEHPWLVAEKQAIRDWVAAGRPYFGVCFGHQLLAVAMGGTVGPMTEAEVGVRDVSLTPDGMASPLFAGIAPSFPTLQWHGAAVTALPDGALALAANAHCPVQAIQIGANAFGIQYHVELTEETVPEWGAIDEYRCALESVTGEGGQAILEQDVAHLLPIFKAEAERLYRNFRAVVEAHRALRSASSTASPG
ncbi:type 1 glutamine amidotransferase [Xanthobacter sp. DSM 24535]|uniref:type 1 glutamine amidotransferase n=1 Tax=Roseixanthobacter psychrophilus TaxID=3119917 RepID=UPI00372A8A1C